MYPNGAEFLFIYKVEKQARSWLLNYFDNTVNE
jgi:hypothetical protein